MQSAPTVSSAIPVFPGSSQLDLYGLGQLPQIATGLQAPKTTRFGGMASQDTITTTPIQYSTAQSLLNTLTNLSATNPNAFAQVQSEMYNAGFYSSKPTYGTWTGKDGDALGEAMRGFLAVSQSGTPVTWSQWLAGAASIGAGDTAATTAASSSGGGGGATRAPLQLTSTATLNAESTAEGQNELGRNLTTDEQAGFANKYHGEETAAYNGSAQAAGAVDSEAKNYIDTTNQAGVQSNLSVGYAQKMLQMLGVQSS